MIYFRGLPQVFRSLCLAFEDQEWTLTDGGVACRVPLGWYVLEEPPSDEEDLMESGGKGVKDWRPFVCPSFGEYPRDSVFLQRGVNLGQIESFFDLDNEEMSGFDKAGKMCLIHYFSELQFSFISKDEALWVETLGQIGDRTGTIDVRKGPNSK